MKKFDWKPVIIYIVLLGLTLLGMHACLVSLGVGAALRLSESRCY